ncbi:unnamed protein product [Caenorhabditis auriculariae]|uniref:Uncharacterized protein n=1 Tax=Caenorhabditis auriculariae TaxID=2777116 RepID=A0A8S1GW56_9PELO|nr:unnamed protein product [Caenorhabditis auriculariae]
MSEAGTVNQWKRQGNRDIANRSSRMIFILLLCRKEGKKGRKKEGTNPLAGKPEPARASIDSQQRREAASLTPTDGNSRQKTSAFDGACRRGTAPTPMPAGDQNAFLALFSAARPPILIVPLYIHYSPLSAPDFLSQFFIQFP